MGRWDVVCVCGWRGGGGENRDETECVVGGWGRGVRAARLRLSK